MHIAIFQVSENVKGSQLINVSFTTGMTSNLLIGQFKCSVRHQSAVCSWVSTVKIASETWLYAASMKLSPAQSVELSPNYQTMM